MRIDANEVVIYTALPETLLACVFSMSSVKVLELLLGEVS